MASVHGAEKLNQQLQAKVLKSSKQDVAVGYTANYAVYVHENLEAHHPVGQAKFLEEPFRTMRDQLVASIVKAVNEGMPLQTAMLLAGLKLQRASQLLVPVDTGNLKGSAFTRLE